VKNLKWMFKDISKIDISKLSDEELLSLRNYVEKRIFKNGSHLIRLLKMGTELLLTGRINVMRPDAKHLLDIKQGKFSLKQVTTESELLFEEMRAARSKSVLKDTVDKNKIDALLISILKEKFL